MVLDTSAVLAIFLNEQYSGWIVSQIERYNGPVKMSTVNLAEVLIIIRDRRPGEFHRIQRELKECSFEFIAPDFLQAEIAAKARIDFPINLGDCFAYALSKSEKLPLLTLEQDFIKTDIEVLLPPH